MGKGVVAAEVNAAQVAGDHAVPLGGLHVLHGHLMIDAGAADQDIQMAEALREFADHLLNFIFFGHIRLKKFCLTWAGAIQFRLQG